MFSPRAAAAGGFVQPLQRLLALPDADVDVVTFGFAISRDEHLFASGHGFTPAMAAAQARLR